MNKTNWLWVFSRFTICNYLWRVEKWDCIIKPCIELPEFEFSRSCWVLKEKRRIIPFCLWNFHIHILKAKEEKMRRKCFSVLSIIAFALLFQGYCIYLFILVPHVTLVLWGTYQGLFSKNAQDKEINKSKAKPDLVQISFKVIKIKLNHSIY